MIRQQRRSELRKLEKEYNRIVTNKQFQRVLNSKDFENIKSEELDLLKNKEHTNRQLQTEFTFGYVLLARVKELENKISKLKNYPT